MPLPRFFVDLPLNAGALVALPDAVAHHALRVLRLTPPTRIVLFNGAGGSWTAELQTQGKHAYAQLLEHDAFEAELPGRITLVQGIASGDKMDFIVEKAVELGVTGIAPIAAQRSVIRLTGERQQKRLQHWRRIVVAACEQCGRNRLPPVYAPLTVQQWLQAHAHDYHVVLLCEPGATTPLATVLQPIARGHSIALLVGPEGGWSNDEMQAAESHGARTVSFGPRVLRTETAGLALTAATCALLGWND